MANITAKTLVQLNATGAPHDWGLSYTVYGSEDPIYYRMFQLLPSYSWLEISGAYLKDKGEYFGFSIAQDEVLIGSKITLSTIPYGEIASNFGIDAVITIGEGDFLVQGSSGNDSWYGSLGNNDEIFGFGGRDALWGGIGFDTLNGGSGNDTLYGGFGNDQLLGDTGNDWLNGDAGNDILDGGFGVDTMEGGTGSDTYIVDNSNDQVIEIANGGTDKVRASVSYLLTGNVENLVLTGNSHLNGIGNALANAINGNAGNNRLSGLAGNDILNGGAGDDILDGGTDIDRMTGGIGNDIYIVDRSGDLVVEFTNKGIDLVRSAANYALAANVENLTLTGTAALAGTGNALANSINGNAGNNRLSGLAGNDILNGGTGNDILNGGTGIDKIRGGPGNDVFVFKEGSDRDLILDFQNNIDTIRLLDLGVFNFAQARTFAKQSASNVVFDFGDGDILTIQNTTINALGDDLIFA